MWTCWICLRSQALFQHAEFKQVSVGMLQHNLDLILRCNLQPIMRERVEAEALFWHDTS